MRTRPANKLTRAITMQVEAMKQSRNRRLYGTSGDIVGASASWPRTRILALTSEVQLHRPLARETMAAIE